MWPNAQDVPIDQGVPQVQSRAEIQRNVERVKELAYGERREIYVGPYISQAKFD